MKNVIAGMMFLSLVWAGWAEPVQPSPTTLPPANVTVTTTTIEQQSPKPEVKVKEDVAPAPTTKPENEKPRKKKEPLVIKFREF